MFSLGLGASDRNPGVILVLGAHADDIEIGAGGTIRQCLRHFPDVKLRWVVFSASDARRPEAFASARTILGTNPSHEIEVHSFRDGFFPYEGALIKDVFEEIKRRCNPDVVLTHHMRDLHQDHRVIGELTWNTFRDHLILEYEIPKYDGGLGTPNLYVPLPSEIVDRKVSELISCFVTQRQKSWFTEDSFRSLMRIRGIECRARTGLAEAFYCRKGIWDPGR